MEDNAQRYIDMCNKVCAQSHDVSPLPLSSPPLSSPFSSPPSPFRYKALKHAGEHTWTGQVMRLWSQCTGDMLSVQVTC